MNAALDENDEAMVEEIGLHRNVVILSVPLVGFQVAVGPDTKAWREGEPPQKRHSW